MIRAALLGDSIRLNYRAKLADLLDGRVDVQGPDENCRFSAYTLFHLTSWAPDDNYDVIQWNNGQWDTCVMPDGKIHTPLPMYLELQERIATILLKKTKRLVFATTSPVWPEQYATATVNRRRNEDIEAYNAAAGELMDRLGVEINDLYGALSEDVNRYICDDMVHLSPAGVDLCATRVATYFDMPSAG